MIASSYHSKIIIGLFTNIELYDIHIYYFQTYIKIYEFIKILHNISWRDGSTDFVQ